MSDHVTQERLDQAIRDVQFARLKAIKARYDSTSARQSRRRVNHGTVTGDEDDQIRMHERMRQMQQARQLWRSTSSGRALVRSYVTAVYGSGPKLAMRTDDEDWNRAANRVFARWSRDADGRLGRTRADHDRMLIRSRIIDGDVLLWFDRAGVLGRPGAVYAYAASRLAEVSEIEFRAARAAIAARLDVADPSSLRQRYGVILDRVNRPVAYIVAKYHGVMVTPLKADGTHPETTILPATDATLLADRWAADQVRGVSTLAPIANDLQDVGEIQDHMLTRMKAQATLAMVIKTMDPTEMSVGRSDDNSSGEELDEESDDAADLVNYEALEALCAGALEYILPTESVESFSLPGDVPDYDQLRSSTLIAAGWALGLTRLHSTGQADASYSATRAEANLTEDHFRVEQKWWERYLEDWQALRVLSWAISTGELSAPPDDWREHMVWTQWPSPKSIDPLKEAKAREADLGNLIIGFEELLGPDWKIKLERRKKELETLGMDTELIVPRAYR